MGDRVPAQGGRPGGDREDGRLPLQGRRARQGHRQEGLRHGESAFLSQTDIRPGCVFGSQTAATRPTEPPNPIDFQVEEYDAVVSTIGGTPADPKADSEGNINLIEAAVAKGKEQGRMPKFVLVTSIGTGDSQGAPPPQVYEALKPVLVEKVKAEDKLKELAEANGMEFCIVRPGGLKSEPATGTGVLTEDVNICGAIHRADVASLVVKCVLKDSANGKVLSCVDKEQLFDQPAFEEFAL